MSSNILDLSVEEFIELCKQWKNETNPDLSNIKPTECPVHVFAAMKGNKACYATNPGIAHCDICDHPRCPICYNHNNTTQLSRVTGYIQTVNGFNNAKKQEVKDRKRHNIA